MNLLVSFFPVFHVLFTFFFLDIFHISPPFPNCFPTPSPKEQTAPLCQWQTVTVLGDAEPWPKRRSLRPDGSWWILMTKYVGFSLLNHGEMVSGGCWKLFGDGINNVVSATHSTPEIHTVHIFEGYNDQPVFLLDLNLPLPLLTKCKNCEFGVAFPSSIHPWCNEHVGPMKPMKFSNQSRLPGIRGACHVFLLDWLDPACFGAQFAPHTHSNSILLVLDPRLQAWTKAESIFSPWRNTMLFALSTPCYVTPKKYAKRI